MLKACPATTSPRSRKRCIAIGRMTHGAGKLNTSSAWSYVPSPAYCRQCCPTRAKKCSSTCDRPAPSLLKACCSPRSPTCPSAMPMRMRHCSSNMRQPWLPRVSCTAGLEANRNEWLKGAAQADEALYPTLFGRLSQFTDVFCAADVTRQDKATDDGYDMQFNPTTWHACGCCRKHDPHVTAGSNLCRRCSEVQLTEAALQT